MDYFYFVIMVKPTYLEFAFFVDRSGRRAKPDFVIYWEGQPKQFAFCMPFILAFDDSFIEIRDVNTGDLEQIIRGSHIQCLDNNCDHMLIVTNHEKEELSYQRIFILTLKDS
eukprot:NODE_264_length_11354_cov_1.067170.p9 type:complete len:112 gc:universal NODE_264_length_11354_cov_1.067170:6110-5775(-)